MSYESDQKREYQREWIRERRRLFFRDKFCFLCGSFYNLQLHHNDPELKISHNVWSWSEERRKEEIKKCSIYCKDCHKAYHSSEKKIWDRPQDGWAASKRKHYDPIKRHEKYKEHGY